MPDVAMTGADGTTIRPSDFLGRPLVLFFYPKDDTPGCTAENKEFSALAGEFESAGVMLLGISKDSSEKHAKFAAKHGLACPLASDAEGHGIAEALGIWAEKRLYGRSYMGMERTTYLVGPDGRIVRVWRKVKVAGHAGEVLHVAWAS
jgi:peroxiredoxin Q/BCP